MSSFFDEDELPAPMPNKPLPKGFQQLPPNQSKNLTPQISPSGLRARVEQYGMWHVAKCQNCGDEIGWTKESGAVLCKRGPCCPNQEVSSRYCPQSYQICSTAPKGKLSDQTCPDCQTVQHVNQDGQFPSHFRKGQSPLALRHAANKT